MVLEQLKTRLGLMTSDEAKAKASHYDACMQALAPDDPMHVDYSIKYYDYALYADLLAA